ncbi:hypothetical protein BESB_033990 [Besnoitia besnoiti]|uniref:SRS domain-containing protein n=1 Tax=Besnoitia besnoiti TaxID=94643 RepID=A0A2A9MKW8_BESBE|nr:hypothetical protein BESB_033990 [Besnoitia besnoiti]PFH36941.1 hypothetical protein BESB_033990 [Besnoitia besnoiti]
MRSAVCYGQGNPVASAPVPSVDSSCDVAKKKEEINLTIGRGQSSVTFDCGAEGNATLSPESTLKQYYETEDCTRAQQLNVLFSGADLTTTGEGGKQYLLTIPEEKRPGKQLFFKCTIPKRVISRQIQSLPEEKKVPSPAEEEKCIVKVTVQPAPESSIETPPTQDPPANDGHSNTCDPMESQDIHVVLRTAEESTTFCCGASAQLYPSVEPTEVFVNSACTQQKLLTQACPGAVLTKSKGQGAASYTLTVNSKPASDQELYFRCIAEETNKPNGLRSSMDAGTNNVCKIRVTVQAEKKSEDQQESSAASVGVGPFLFVAQVTLGLLSV